MMSTRFIIVKHIINTSIITKLIGPLKAFIVGIALEIPILKKRKRENKMSEENKQSAETIKKIFEKVQEGSRELVKKAGEMGDKNLQKKIEKVHEGAGEVVKHIEERQ